MRATPYLIGILAGYLKYQMNVKNYKIPKKLVILGWTVSGPLLFFPMYTGFVFYAIKVPTAYSALYACLYHFCWSVSIAWIIIAISSGNGRKCLHYDFLFCILENSSIIFSFNLPMENFHNIIFMKHCCIQNTLEGDDKKKYY